jgi:hypothetical protein
VMGGGRGGGNDDLVAIVTAPCNFGMWQSTSWLTLFILKSAITCHADGGAGF